MSWRDLRLGYPVNDRLADGGTAVGSFVQLGSPEVADICGHAGCAFLLIDLEHSATSWSQLGALIVSAEAAETTPIVRVSNATRDLITRVLDLGAHGVMVAQVDDAATASAVVAATRYGPNGTRGSAGGRGSGWGMRMTAAEYQDAANASTFVSVQVENRRSVDAVDEIAAVEGLDCVFVGLSDLTSDLGILGQWDHPDLDAALGRVHAACDARGVAVGYPALDVAMARKLFDRGGRLIATGDTGQLARAMSSFVTEVQSFSE